MSYEQLPEGIKHIFDGVSIASVLGTLAGYLPAMAAGASLVWTVIRIYETKTVQRMLGRRAVRSRSDD